MAFAVLLHLDDVSENKQDEIVKAIEKAVDSVLTHTADGDAYRFDTTHLKYNPEHGDAVIYLP